MSKVEEAATLFERYNCAQSVFAACGCGEGLSQEMCLILAGPVWRRDGTHGGNLRRGGGCAAGAGRAARTGDGHRSGVGARDRSTSAWGKLTEAFRARHGALTCRELTGCDLRTPEGQADFKNRGLHRGLCQGLVTSAVALVEDPPARIPAPEGAA